MGASNSRENDLDSDSMSGSSRGRAPLEPRRHQGGLRAPEILYNLEQLYRSGFVGNVAHRSALRRANPYVH